MTGQLNRFLIYGFFDGPQDLRAQGYAGGDRMSLLQFIVMGVIFALIVLVSVLLRKAKKERLTPFTRFWPFSCRFSKSSKWPSPPITI